MFRCVKKYLAVFVIGFFCLPVFCHAQYGSDEEGVFFVARKAFEDGYYEVSLGIFNRFLKDFPGSPKAGEAELLSGESYFYQNKLAEALFRFESLLDKPSARGIKDAVIYWIAETHFKSNDFSKAAKAYRRLIDEFPNSSYAPLAFYSLGWSLFEEGKFQDSLGYFKAMEDKYPREPQALDASFKIVECLYKLKDYPALKSKARQLLKLFAKDTPRLAYLYFYLAEAEYYLNNFNRALEFFRKALKENSDSRLHALSRLGLGWSYLKLKEYKKSEEEFAFVNEAGLDKEILESLVLGKADSLLRQGKLKEAEVFLQKAARLSDDKFVKEGALVQVADIYYDLGDYSEAIEAYKALLKAFPAGRYKDYILYRISTASYVLGLGYFQKEDYKSGIKVLDECRRNFKEAMLLPDLSYLLGSCYYNLGDFNKAIENFREVLSRSQDAQLLQKAEYGIADSFYYLGNEKEALLRFNALRSRYPGSSLAAKALFWLAGYYYQRNELDIAARYFLSLVQDFPANELVADAYYSLGLISSSNGAHKEAILNFKKAGELGNPDIRFVSIFALAETLEAQGDFKAAIDEYLKASADNKFKERAFLRIARIYEDREDLKEALTFYAKAAEAGGKGSAYAKERISWIESIIRK